MDTTKKDVKETIESSTSEEELLNNIDTLNPLLTDEEMSNVNGGIDIGDTGPCGHGNRYY